MSYTRLLFDFLAAFKHAKDELARCQRERDQLQQQVQKLQETENKEPQKAHADSSGTWKYQELKNQENLYVSNIIESINIVINRISNYSYCELYIFQKS